MTPDLWCLRVPLGGCHLAHARSREFREGVVAVARDRDPGVPLRKVAADFGISETCLQNWMRQADVEAGTRPGATMAEADELREAK